MPPIRVRGYPLATPLVKIDIAIEVATTGVIVEPPGSLLIADYNGDRYSLFASAPAGTSARSGASLITRLAVMAIERMSNGSQSGGVASPASPDYESVMRIAEPLPNHAF